MSQPHPPIPEPQPHPGAEPPLPVEDDEPRTQSILLPPSQRQTEQPVEPDRQPTEPAQQTSAEAAPQAGSTGAWGSPAEPAATASPLPDQRPLPPPGTAQLPAQPGAAPAQAAPPQAGPPPHEPALPSQVAGPVDFVPGFGDRPPVAVHGSSAVHHAPAPQSHASATAAGAPGPHHGIPAGGTSDGARRSPLAALQEVRRTGPALPALVLAVLALVLLELGLSLDYGTQSLWDVVPTWSVFATAAALLAPLAVAAGLTGKLPARTAWRVAAGGVGALALFWVLVALPIAASDRGFWLTAALAASGAALWLAPGRTT